MIKVDGRNYNVSVIDVDLDAEFLYKYAERTEDYALNYELGAVFYNQSITFGVEDTKNQDFVDLYKLLTSRSNIDEGTGHNVEIWTPMGKSVFTMYPNRVNVKLYKERDGVTWWSGMNVKFISTKPAKRW